MENGTLYMFKILLSFTTITSPQQYALGCLSKVLGWARAGRQAVRPPGGVLAKVLEGALR